jgi:PAS domain S-box-containing protein
MVRLEIATDITERKLTESALFESQVKSQALLDAIPDMIFILDREGVFMDYHVPKGQELFAPQESFLGKNIREVMPPHVVASYFSILDQTFLSRRSQIFGYALDMPDGRHHYEAHIVTYGRQDILAIIRDITERKKSEDTLLKNEKLLAESHGNSPTLDRTPPEP